MKKAKFSVGQVVIAHIDEPFKILRKLYDPCDGWLYSDKVNDPRFTFETDLRPLTAREAGRKRRKGLTS